MTSPIGGKPDPTQDKYDDVHSRGSSFGAELDEQSVRKLLGNQVENPFANAFKGFFDAGTALINEVADAIGDVIPDGARSTPIRDALIKQIGPIRTQVGTLGQNLQKLSTEVTERIDTQEGILEDTQGHIDTMSSTLEEQKATLAQNQEELDAARQETSTAISQSQSAVDLANKFNKELTAQITTKFNAAINKAEEGISKAETANSELIKMNTDLGAITQQASDLNEKLSAQNEKFTAGLEDANTAIDEAKDLTAAVKATAEQNKKDVASAVSKADKANSDLATLTPKVTDAVSKADKASSDVSTLTPKVTTASQKAGKASQDVAALSPKVTDAVNQSEKAISDVADLTPKVSAAQEKADSAYTEAENVRNEVSPKIEEAQTKGESALAVADKAVDWLRNPKEIGASLIAIDPETDRPNWAEYLDPVTAEENPLNLPNAYKTGELYTRNPRRMTVNVDPSTEYMVSLWVKADKPGSAMTYDIRNQAGELAFGKRRTVDGFLDAGDNWRAFWIKNVPTEWTQYKKIVTPRETTRTAEFGYSYFKHSSGDTQDVVQYIADLQMYPLVPSQLDVDQAQNDAIKANQDILRQQEEINDQQAKFNAFQTQFNKDQIEWNQASEDATQALQNFATLQDTVNDEQTKFNNFQSDFNEKQIEWNDAVDRSLATQDTVNDNFRKWTDGAETAISANTSAIKALGKIDTGESLIAYLTPTDAEVRAGKAKYDVPVWTTAAHREFSGQNKPPEHVKNAFGASSSDGTKTAKTVPVTVRPGTKYILSFWAYGSGDLVVYMYGNGGGFPVKSTRQLLVDQDSLSIMKDSGGRRRYNPDENGNSSNSNGTQWLLSGFKPDELYKWVHYKFEVEFTEPTTEVWFNSFYWNWRTDSTYGQYLADMQFYPDVPTQADIDEAQNKAIQANKDLLVEQERINVEQGKINQLRKDFEVEQGKINDKQTGINALNTKTDESLLQGLKALGKKSLGASLVPYKTPSDQEVKDYADGKLNYDPWEDPEYFEAGETVSSNSTYGRYARASSSQGTKSYNGTLVSVDNTIEYRIKFRAYAYTEGSVLVVSMKDQDGSTAVQSTSVRDQGTMAGTSYPIHYLTLRKGWHTYSGRIRFKDTTTAASLSTFYWNHPNGTSTTQCLTDLEIVPDVPTQDDLNLNFQDNFSKIDKELGLIKSTDSSFRADQTKWNKASSDATKSLQNFQSQQTELNNLFQEQMWAQQDMIEQLDIQQPRVFHAKTTDGSFKTAPDWTTWSTCRYHENPFILHLTRHEDTKKMYWQAKGKWEGKLKVTTNWTNGASDVMVYDITRDEANIMSEGRGGSTKLSKAARSYAESGGAWGTDLRNSTFEIYPVHLGRSVGIRNTSSGWYVDQSVMGTGGPSMVRHQTSDEVRFTNSFYCSVAFYARDMKGKKTLVKANQVVEPMMIRRSDLRSNTTYVFYEKPFTTNTW